MPKNHYLMAAILGLIITTAVVSVTTFAQTNATALRPNFIEHRPELRQAMTDGDYESWSEMMKEKVERLRTHATELENKINQSTFDRLTEAHQLMQEGKIDEAKAVFEELGMPGPAGHRGMKGIKGMSGGWRQAAAANAQN